jgi:hypothetical protein
VPLRARATAPRFDGGALCGLEVALEVVHERLRVLEAVLDDPLQLRIVDAVAVGLEDAGLVLLLALPRRLRQVGRPVHEHATPVGTIADVGLDMDHVRGAGHVDRDLPSREQLVDLLGQPPVPRQPLAPVLGGAVADDQGEPFQCEVLIAHDVGDELRGVRVGDRRQLLHVREQLVERCGAPQQLDPALDSDVPRSAAAFDPLLHA